MTLGCLKTKAGLKTSMTFTIGTLEWGLNCLRGLVARQSRLSLGLYFISLSLLCHLLWKLCTPRRNNPEGLPFPPGPKPLPIVGNLFDFARENESAAYLGMARTYGELPDPSFC